MGNPAAGCCAVAVAARFFLSSLIPALYSRLFLESSAQQVKRERERERKTQPGLPLSLARAAANWYEDQSGAVPLGREPQDHVKTNFFLNTLRG